MKGGRGKLVLEEGKVLFQHKLFVPGFICLCLFLKQKIIYLFSDPDFIIHYLQQISVCHLFGKSAHDFIKFQCSFNFLRKTDRGFKVIRQG